MLSPTRVVGRFCLRWPGLVVFAVVITLSAILSTLLGPQSHAQSPPEWGGTVEVDAASEPLTLGPGETVTYRIRLSEKPLENHNGGIWWVRIHVDGTVRYDGDYNGITWIPSVGWEFNTGNWDQWRTISIAADDTVEKNTKITFTHEVWATSEWCPIHDVGTVRVKVNWDEGGGNSGNSNNGNRNNGGGTNTDDEVDPNNGGGNSNDGDINGGGTNTEDEVNPNNGGDINGGGTNTEDEVNPNNGGGNNEGGNNDNGDNGDGNNGGNNGNDGNGGDGNGGDGNGGDGNGGDGNGGDGNGGDGNGGDGNGGDGNGGDGNGGDGNGGDGNGGNGGDGGDGGGEPVLSSLSIADATVIEGSVAEFVVTLSPASEQTVTVDYQTTSGSAVAGEDFETASGTLTFAPNATQQTVSVQTRQDDLDEPSELFGATLSRSSGATIEAGNGTATGTILDDDQATISIADTSVEEGSTAEFIVTLSMPSWQRVTVGYQTSNGTAVAGQDFEAMSGTLTFYPGDTRKSVRVQTHEDDLDEPDETFTVTLFRPSGATLADASATGTIVDDDVSGLSISDAWAVEGTTARFTVTLSPVSEQTVTVDYQTAGGTATAGLDFEAASGTLTFGPRITRQIIEVQTRADDLDEPDETFAVALSSPSGATLADGTATGTITDDDQASLSIADATVEEGGTAEFVVTMNVPSTESVTVSYRTTSGTAAEGTDFDAASGTLTFSAGEMEKRILVRTLADDLDEPDETFTVALSSPSGAGDAVQTERRDAGGRHRNGHDYRRRPGKPFHRGRDSGGGEHGGIRRDDERAER